MQHVPVVFLLVSANEGLKLIALKESFENGPAELNRAATILIEDFCGVLCLAVTDRISP